MQGPRRPLGEVQLVSDRDASQIRTARLSVVPGGPPPVTEAAAEAQARRRARRIALALMAASALVMIAIIAIVWVLLRGV